MPAHRAPAPAETIRAALVEAEARLVPIDTKALAVMLNETLALWPVPVNWEKVSEFYVEALEDVPIDLVEKALRSVRLNYRWNTMPKPADFRAPIRAELGRRRREVFKLLVARTRAEEEEREETERTGKYRSELTTKEREEFDRKVEKLLAEVRAAAAAPV